MQEALAAIVEPVWFKRLRSKVKVCRIFNMISESNIDVLVVSPRFDGGRNRKDINLLWRIAARSDSRIEPVPCGEKQWREDDGRAIVEIARRDGERVSVG